MIFPGDVVVADTDFHVRIWSSDVCDDELFEPSSMDVMLVISVGMKYALVLVRNILGYVNASLVDRISSRSRG